MAPAHAASPVIHERPAVGEAHELLGFQRAVFWLRLAGAAITVVLATGAQLTNPILVIAAVALTAGTAVAQRLTLRADLPLATIRQRALLFLAADVVAVYLIGTAFAAQQD